MKILELFSGYGSQALALENLGIEFTSDISEIDKYTIQAYNQLHGDTHNWGDITKIDETKLPYYDLITYSSPCQDFSTAGLQRGGDKGSGTRSSLLWECERIIRTVKPKYLLMENVKNLIGKQHRHNFDKWLDTLDSIGYNNYWKVLNAKDYGIPQNRERVFVVSIRKDLDTKGYKFPEKKPLLLKLKDVLEPIVDEKYYLPQEKANKFLKSFENPETSYCLDANYHKGISVENYLNKHRCQLVKDVSNTIRCGGRGSLDTKHSWDLIYVGASRGRNPENSSDRTSGIQTEQRLEINQTGCSNTLTTVQKDNLLVQVLTPKRTEYGKTVRKDYESGKIRESRHNMTAMMPRNDGISNTLTTVQKDNYVIQQIGNIIETDSYGGNPQCGRIYGVNGCCPCLSTMQGGGREPKIIIGSTQKNAFVGSTEKYSPCLTQVMGMGGGQISMLTDCTRIRKLTPRECWRLMGVKDEQFNKLNGISNTQLYKMAGNSIVVDVLMSIFKNLFEE